MGISYSSTTYNLERKSCNNVVYLSSHKFFIIHCYLSVSGELFFIGKEAKSQTILSSQYSSFLGKSLTLELPHIHQVEIASVWEIVNVQQILKKCLYIEVEDKKFCVLINNNYAY